MDKMAVGLYSEPLEEGLSSVINEAGWAIF